eukprot:NODE_10185_length_448_cov_9.741855_g9081_i0.p1 GENE.NODE_10185_length_448_cov_9.741855_g9081_i0~~NODE_10185_length_448_cov_9.741855_g9081_i0.p1  ORF type:complete len:111 (+),score=41.70 NODE_10185_length_448_cov_9.741855_g9081_i0:78-410(+)
MSAEDFDKAVAFIRALPKEGDIQPSNEQKLKFYGLFKQATEGDVQGTQPWAVQFEARAKWDAWNSRKGMSADEAKKLYVEALDEMHKEHNTGRGYDGKDWREIDIASLGK